MPRRTTYLLRWLEEEQAYELTGVGVPIVEPQDLRLGTHAWFDWLEQVTSFAFASRFGVLVWLSIFPGQDHQAVSWSDG